MIAEGSFGAGIGGGEGGMAAVIVAGFNSFFGGDGGEFMMTDGTVSAVGMRGAGIGGGSSGDSTNDGPPVGTGGDGGSISVMGGSLPANGYRGAGIGGGDTGEHDNSTSPGSYWSGGDAATVIIGEDATVQALRTGTTQSAIGPGEVHESVSPRPNILGSRYRTISLDGVLELPSGSRVVVPASGAVRGNGQITGVGGAGGTVVNHGIVTPQVDLEQVDVTVRNYPVTFELNAPGNTEPAMVVNVFAPSMAAGERDVPAVTSPGVTLSGWNHSADGTGAAFTASTSLSGPLTVYGQWEPLEYEMTPNMPDAVVGHPVTFSIGAIGGSPAGDLSDEFTFTASGGEPEISGNSVVFTRPGSWAVTATHDVTGEILAAGVNAELDRSDPDTIELALTAVNVLAGGSVTTTVTGVDAYGNDLGELTDLAVIDTGDASDGVTAGEIRFGHWGSRTVTASVGSASDDQALTVWPVTSDYVLSASPDSLLVGDEVQLTVMLGGESGADVTSEFDFTAAATGATVDGDAVMFTQPGTHTVVATHRDTGVELEVDVSATLDRTSPADITLSMSANTVDEGESLSFGVTGTDRFGNDLGNLSDLASVTSSHATDLIDPDGTIYFPTASEHTITAVIGQATASVVVTVAPATVPAQDNPRDAGQAGLSSTGVDGAIWAVGAIALLALGLGVFLLVRRKSGSDAGTDT